MNRKVGKLMRIKTTWGDYADIERVGSGQKE